MQLLPPHISILWFLSTWTPYSHIHIWFLFFIYPIFTSLHLKCESPTLSVQTVQSNWFNWSNIYINMRAIQEYNGTSQSDSCCGYICQCQRRSELCLASYSFGSVSISIAGRSSTSPPASCFNSDHAYIYTSWSLYTNWASFCFPSQINTAGQCYR